MKICENCGMEYGDDNAFCPFCDERYGVVILADDVISADGLPPYKEEFPVVGETGVKLESFAANRDKIYKRNIRLAVRENFLPKMEVRTAYKPVVPLAEIDRGGAISPYKPPNPIVEKFNNIRKKIKAVRLSKIGKAFLRFIFVAVIFLITFGVSWFETTDIYEAYQQKKIDEEHEKTYAGQAAYSEAFDEISEADHECSYIYGRDGAVMTLLKRNDGEDWGGYWEYKFTFENETGKELYDFTELFAGAEGMEQFGEMYVNYPRNASGRILIIDGVPDIESEELYLPVLEPFPLGSDKFYHTVKTGEMVLGYFSVKADSSHIPEKIVIKGEDRLELRLSYVDMSSVEGVYTYAYTFTNTTNENMIYFCNRFIGAEYTDRFRSFSVLYPNNDKYAFISWRNGVPSYVSYSGVDEHGRSTTIPPCVCVGDTVSGYIDIDFRDD